ncbi:SRPBCC family protein [Nonomuraea basaltis]|uniref:SRPBCC family protein n=1 Tax=Nonomuraea basaltis TaxID=2495887 RepID=UPI00110C697B|nr:SRPBCC family protein [Nonomuraea basaltis]TMR90126.1 activator of HSP90 ATPase [Nonomuraea basaltis]
MTPSIEREILIEAPVEVVWHAVTEPSQISSWFTDAAEIDVHEGGKGTLTWTGRATVKPATAEITVVAVEPPRLFSFRWAYPDGAQPREGNSVLVEFTLAQEGEGTRLRVTESGLSEIDWTEENKASYAQDHINGWSKHLSDLVAYVVAKDRASVQ